MTPQELDALRADMRTQAATRIAQLNAPSSEPTLPPGNPLKGNVKNPTGLSAYLRGNAVDPAKTQSAVKMGLHPEVANDIEQIRRASNSGVSGLPKLGETLGAPGSRAGYIQSLAGDTNYRLPNFVEPPLKALPLPTQGPPEAAGPRMPPGQRYASPIGPPEAAGPPEMHGPRNIPGYTMGPPEAQGPRMPPGQRYMSPIGPEDMAGPRMPPGMRYTSPIGPPRPPTGAMADLRAIGGSLGNAFERATGAVAGSRVLNNPLTRTLGRASGPLGSAMMVKGAWDEMSDPTSRANQHNALYNQALEEGRYGDAVGEGAMSVANTVGAATGLRSIYDFLAGNGAQAKPAAPAAAAANAQTSQLLTFARAAQQERYMRDESPETPEIRVRYGNNGRQYSYNHNAQTGRYDETTPEQVAAAAASRGKLAMRMIDANGKVRAAEAATRTPLTDYKTALMARYAELARQMRDPNHDPDALKAEKDGLDMLSLQLQALEKPHNAVQTFNFGGSSSNGDE